MVQNIICPINLIENTSVIPVNGAFTELISSSELSNSRLHTLIDFANTMRQVVFKSSFNSVSAIADADCLALSARFVICICLTNVVVLVASHVYANVLSYRRVRNVICTYCVSL